MAGSGEYYRRADNRWAFRVLADNGAIVAVDGSQGYENEQDCVAVLRYLMSGGYNGPVTKTTG